ncbi:hypothetical protein FDP41_000233 [Naegleria fowleri]|uniref:Uncharacterized protein n=1 Tax=Naegleria fowleri TaxID=5763 RepID=A0A6A5CF24_NAEFO|nr:uncharacterized protein FDP41_000233 [Naegleria fowleri]KAF0985194.1 hypothetical protein FDP41_000233 [Naegleria fowleri]CAG4714257.1 unnamed protein product [Naegleria fowleri]
MFKSTSSAASLMLNNSTLSARYACIIDKQIYPFKQTIQNSIIINELNFNDKLFSKKLHQHITIYFMNINNIVPNVTSIIYINDKYYGTLDKFNHVLQVELLPSTLTHIVIKEMNTLIFNTTFKETKETQSEMLENYKDKLFECINMAVISNYIKTGKIQFDSTSSTVGISDLDKFFMEQETKRNNDTKKFKSILQVQLSDLTDRLSFQTKNMSPNGSGNDSQLIEWAVKQFKQIESDIMNKYLNILHCVNILRNFNPNIMNANSETNLKQIELLFELIQDKSLDKISTQELKGKRKEVNYMIQDRIQLLKKLMSTENPPSTNASSSSAGSSSENVLNSSNK